MPEDFTWRDGERIVRFAPGAFAEAPSLLEEAGFADYVLLTTGRVDPGGLSGAATLDVPSGKVDEISAGLLAEVGERDVVALGGGRVVDTAKAIAGARGTRSAAIPTTLSGAEMTPFHRLPAGVEGARMTRPSLVGADPELMASQPHGRLEASAMNALAHAMEALYTPMSSPVPRIAALRAAELLAGALPRPDPDRADIALAALLAGYASGSAGIGVHHAVCQTIVRGAGSPHAETNAVMLPHFAGLMAVRAYEPMSAFATALGDPQGDPEAAAGHVARLAGRSAHTRLSTLGVEAAQLPGIAEAALRHPAVANTPEPPNRDELERLLEAAL